MTFKVGDLVRRKNRTIGLQKKLRIGTVAKIVEIDQKYPGHTFYILQGYPKTLNGEKNLELVNPEDLDHDFPNLNAVIDRVVEELK